MDEKLNELLAELTRKSIGCCADQRQEQAKCIHCLQYVGSGICAMKIKYKK